VKVPNLLPWSRRGLTVFPAHCAAHHPPTPPPRSTPAARAGQSAAALLAAPRPPPLPAGGTAVQDPQCTSALTRSSSQRSRVWGAGFRSQPRAQRRPPQTRPHARPPCLRHLFPWARPQAPPPPPSSRMSLLPSRFLSPLSPLFKPSMAPMRRPSICPSLLGFWV